MPHLTVLHEELSEEPPPCCTVEQVAPKQRKASVKVPTISVPTNEQWNDWHWQMRNRYYNLEQIANAIGLEFVDEEQKKAAEFFPVAITPYYLSLIKQADKTDPIFSMAVPQALELNDPSFLRDDPLEEDHDMPVPGLVHRYSDRALVVATSECSMYCRHCTRKRVAGQRTYAISTARLAKIVEYLTQHTEIHDVIISGGDPFTLPTEALEKIIQAIRSVPTVDIIRIGTRTPVVMPMRITDELVNMLKKYHPIWVNTHFNHPVELTPEAKAACTKLADAGIPLGNQSVLLRGVNDSPKIIEDLCRSLVKTRVRPYYLFQCDLVKGVEHFRTPISKGIQIMEHLRGRLSGLAIPSYIVDAPHGGGKIPILPNYIISQSPTHTVLRNYEGMLVNYPEPNAEIAPIEIKDYAVEGHTVADLASGKMSKIQPASSARLTRRSKRTKTVHTFSSDTI